MLREPRALERLRSAAHEAERVVLLGDVLELRHGPLREAMSAAEPVLRALGAALGEGGEVVVAAGNHDHRLLGPWLERRSLIDPARALAPQTEVDWRDGEPLHRLAAWLSPARMRATYPGVWLGPRVYAFHGHYSDLHTTVPTFERLVAGVMARIAGARGHAPSGPDDYEAVLAPVYAWIHAVAERRGPSGPGRAPHGPSSRVWRILNGDGRRGRRQLLRAGAGVGVAGLARAGLGPLSADLSGPELRRAGLRACATALERLGIEADHVVFGHTHRAGPLGGDDPSEWTTASGIFMMNSGSWMNDPAFVGPSPRTSPYRPGFAVRLDDDGPPELINLLDS